MFKYYYKLIPIYEGTLPDNKQFINEDRDVLSNNEIQVDTKINLPIGFYKLIEYDFPNSWKNLESIDDNNPEFNIDNISKKGYDSISYFIESYYDKFYYSLKIDKQNKLNLIPSINKLIDSDKKGFFKIDSAYYSGTILNKNDYTIEIYKDGDKYKEMLGNENTAVINYLTIVSFDDKRNIKDYKTIYHYNHKLYTYENTFFYIDENLDIILKDFDVDETETRFLGTRKYKINEKGIIEEIIIDSNTNEDKNIKSAKEGLSKINAKYQGEFTVSVNTESTTTGIASITYNFTIKENNVNLKEVSYHEPTNCNGNYATKENNNILELFYDGNNEKTFVAARQMADN